MRTCRADLQIALSSTNATEIIFITDLADAPEIGRDNQVLMVRRLSMNRYENNLRMFRQRLINKLLCKGRSLRVSSIHLFWFYFSHSRYSLFPRLLGQARRDAKGHKSDPNYELCCFFHSSPVSIHFFCSANISL